MNEIIKKIDEHSNQLYGQAIRTGHDGMTYNELMGRIQELKWVREIITSSQKEPPTIPKLAQGSRLIKHGMYCSGIKDKEYITEQPLTIGDKIRESNGKTANILHEIADCKKCPVKDGCNANNDYACYGRLFDYLNQPTTDEA